MIRKLSISFVIILFLSVLGSCTLLGHGGDSIDPNSIPLDIPMYDIDGEKVSEISLEEGTSAILRYTEADFDSTAIVKREGVRKKQSVRLGGYFYGLNWEDGSLSENDAEWLAKHVDLFSLQLWSSPYARNKISVETLKEMRAVNKSLQFYAMVWPTTLNRYYYDENTMEDWILKNEIDQRNYVGVRATPSNNYLAMDFGNREFVEFFAQEVKNIVDQKKADGIIIDELPYYDGHYDVNVEDIKNFDSEEELFNASINLLKYLDKELSFTLMNQAYFSEALEFLDGVWGEYNFSYQQNGWHYAGRKIAYEELINYSFNNKSNMPHIFAAWYKRDSRKQMKFAVAFYLLMKNSKNTVLQMQPEFDGGYPNNTAGYNLTTFREEYENNKYLLDIEMGKPVERAKYLGKNVWQRKYENGMVYARLK